MPTTSETGHVKNVANFERLISFSTSYGSSYNPSKAALLLPNITAMHLQAESELQLVINANITYNNFVDARVITFQPISQLATRLVNALTVTDATAEMIKDAKTINRKIQGKRAKEITTPTNPNIPAPITISVSQLSYDKLIEHFAKLIALLQSEPSYAPNESNLKLVTLQALLTQLKTDNTNVINSYTTVSNARISRDVILYQVNTGLVPTALEVKKYVKSVFGATSDQFKQVNNLAFKIIKQ
jgi:hypothetical protein